MVQNKKRIISLILMLTLLVSSLVVGAVTASAAGNVADLNTLATNTSYTTRTTTKGWVATNSAAAKSAMTSQNVSVILNGKKTAKGTLTSPTLSGGISELSFSYGYSYSESKGVNATINIKDTSGKVLATNNLVVSSITQNKAYTYTWTLPTAVTGDFVIEILNNGPSNSTSNKDRLSIWNVTWVGANSSCEHTNKTTTTVDATCTTAGSTTVTCNDCKEVVSKETIPAPGHNYVDDVCTVCGEKVKKATLVTDVSSLKAGDQIVIVATGSDFALSTTQNDNNRGQASVTKVGDTVTFGDDVQIITLKAGNADGTFAFYVEGDSTGYLYAASSSSNYLRTEKYLSSNSSWTISISSDGVATVKANGTYTKNWIRYNTTSSIFSCYSTGQSDICIYKFVQTDSGESACEHANTTETNTATCTEPGTKTVTCLGCGETVSTERSEALGHTWNEGEVTTDPSCKEMGEVTKKCTADNCGETETFAIAMLDHVYSGGKCSECGIDETQINILIHNHALKNEWKNGEKHSSIVIGNITVSASEKGNTGKYYTEGYEWRFYQTDGATLTIDAGAGNVIEWVKITYNSAYGGTLIYNGSSIASGDTLKLGVNEITFAVGSTDSDVTNGQVKITEIVIKYAECKHTDTTTNTIPATCTDAGSTTVTCNSCGEVVSTTEIPELDHNYVNGVCQNDKSHTLFGITLVVPGQEDVTYYPENGKYTLPTTVDTSNLCLNGKEFAGWSTEQEDVTEGDVNNGEVTLENNVTYYAVFKYSAGEKISYYEKVSSNLSDFSGVYLIVYENGKVAFNGGLEKLDGVGNTISVTITDGIIESNATTNAAAFIIEKIDSGYIIKSASGYYIGNDSDSNDLTTNKTTKDTNTISIDGNGNVVIKGSGGSYLRFNAAVDQLRFRYYKSSSYTGQKAIQLYKLVEVDSTKYTTDISVHTAGDVQVENNVAPKCEATGSYENVVYCTECNVELSRETVTVNALDHKDENKDHVCDNNCGVAQGEHADSADDNDHVCDYGCKEVLETCSGGTATCTAQAVCSVCEQPYGENDEDNHTGSAVVVQNGNANLHAIYNCCQTEVTDHGNNYSSEYIDPVCGVDGYTRYTCTCGYYYDDVDEGTALEHSAADWQKENEVPATCNNGGSYDIVVRCTKCNGVLESEGFTTNALGHLWDNACDTDCNRNCGEEGATRETEHKYDNACDTTCNVCGATREITHDYADATCTAPKTCKVCGATTGDVNPENHTGTVHNLTTGGTADKHAVYSCCPNVTANADHSYSTSVTAPTCEDAGYTTYTCTCGHSYTEAGDAATGHSFTNYVSDGNATCTADGTKTAKCDNCDATDTIADVGSKVAHSFTNYVTDGNATCTADGTKTAKCDNCDATNTIADVGSAKGHSANCGHSVAYIGTTYYASLQAALDAANGETVKLLKDVELAGEHLYISGKTLTLNLDGNTITADWATDGVCEVLLVDNGANVTITGDGTMISGNRATTNSVVSVLNGSTLTIENGTFISNNIGDVIFAKYNSTINIKDGYYEAKNSLDGMYFVLDIDENYDGAATDTSKIIVTGGEFVKFNPANHSNDGKDYTNKVAEGYLTTKNGDVYTVTKFALEAGKEIKLEGDLVVKEILLANGTKIDLNGYTIKTDAVVSVDTTSYICDSTGLGKLLVPQNMLQIQAGEYDQVPVWYDGAYYFRTPVNQAKPVTTGNGTFELQFRPSFAINGLKNDPIQSSAVFGAADNNITYAVYVVCYGGEGYTTDLQGIGAELVKDVYTQKKSIKITVNTGAADYTHYDVVLVVMVNGVQVNSFTINGETKISAPEYVAPTEQAILPGDDEEN